jgi:putative peptidoglycan lipid II flippase
VAQAAGVIWLGNLLSRVMGLVRDATIAHFFAATGFVSALTLARQVPQMIYDLLVGGHISAALVPVLSEYTAEEKRGELWRIVSIFLSLVTAALAVAVLLMELLAPWIIAVMGGGYTAGLQQAATVLLRLTTPALLFLGLSGAVTGVLYALKRFAFPAFATAVFNIGIVVAVLLTHERLGVASAALGMLLGAVLQLALQLPGLRGAHVRPRIDLGHPVLRRILKLYLPVILGIVINIVRDVIDRRLASGTGESSIAWMAYATTLVQTGLGLIAAAVSIAVLPALSRADAEHDEAAYQSHLGLGLRLILTLVLPATIGLLALARPAVALLYQHGAFTPLDTTMVTWALYLYLIGLPFAAVDQLLIFAFYARKNTLLPNLVGVYVVGIYLLFALPFVGPWGMFALVIANSAQWVWHALFMLLLLRRRIGWPRGQRLGATLLRATVAATAMGLAVWGAEGLLAQLVGTAGTLARLISVGGAIAVGAGIYLGLAMVLRLEEVRALWSAVARRLGRGRA